MFSLAFLTAEHLNRVSKNNIIITVKHDNSSGGLKKMYQKAHDNIFYTIIDFNQVDIRIYLLEKVIFPKAARLR